MQCQATNEEEIFEVQDKGSLLSLGWIHVSPALWFGCFFFVHQVKGLYVLPWTSSIWFYLFCCIL
jgi:hypothetical protein